MKKNVPSARCGGGSRVSRLSRLRGPRRRIRILAGVLAAVLGLALAACSSSSTTTAAAPGSASAAGASASAKLSGTVVVFAATSLTDAFNKIGAQFQQAQPGRDASSSTTTAVPRWRRQITQGAPADVFASASPTNMKTVTDAEPGVQHAERFRPQPGRDHGRGGQPRAHHVASADLANSDDQGGDLRPGGSVRRPGHHDVQERRASPSSR